MSVNEWDRRKMLEQAFSNMLDQAQDVDPDLSHVEIALQYRQSAILEAKVFLGITPPLNLDKIPGVYNAKTDNGIELVLNPEMVNIK